MSVYSKSDGFKLFRSWVAQQKVVIDFDEEEVWKFYDYGPKDVIPLVCIPPTGGTAECFFRQFIGLCPRGFRLIAVQAPPYLDHDGWVNGFDRLLDLLKIKHVHLFGTSLGGYLAQLYAVSRPQRTASLFLNNTFKDTFFFSERAPCVGMFPFMPTFMLQKLVLASLPERELEKDIAESVDFMVEQLYTVSQEELASRLTLNCIPHSYPIEAFRLPEDQISIMDCFDDVAIPESVRQALYSNFPNCRLHHLKSGGNFPFLSRFEEFNMHLQVHLRRHGVEPHLDEHALPAYMQAAIPAPVPHRPRSVRYQDNHYTPDSQTTP